MAQLSAETGESRQPRGEHRRLQVLEAVLRVISERGVSGLTFRAVAQEARVGLGVVTYYFPARRDLVAGAFRLHLDQMRERGAAFEARSGAGGQSEEALTDAIVAFLEAMARDDRASVIASHELDLELTRDARLIREVDDAVEAHHRNTAALVGRAAGDEAAEEDAAILASVFDALVLGWIARPGDAAYAERVRRIVRRLVQKLL